MIDFDRLRRALVLGALGATAMALLLPPLAALRYTDAHDWYAARKVSVAQALIAAGFDEHALTDYRLADGQPVTWLRNGVASYTPARESRSLILTVIGDNALLGACAGFAVLFVLSGLLNLARREPAAISRTLAHGNSAGERRPGFVEDVPPYDPHVPAGATPAVAVPPPKPVVAAIAPTGGSDERVAEPAPATGARGPPATAKPERRRARPARRPGRWF